MYTYTEITRGLPFVPPGILVYFLIINGPVANAKYRLPMEPVLIILTAIAVERLVWRHLGTRTK